MRNDASLGVQQGWRVETVQAGGGTLSPCLALLFLLQRKTGKPLSSRIRPRPRSCPLLGMCIDSTPGLRGALDGRQWPWVLACQRGVSTGFGAVKSLILQDGAHGLLAKQGFSY